LFFQVKYGIFHQMVERLGGQHLETQVQQPLDLAITTFCNQFSSDNTKLAYNRDLQAFSRFATGVGVDELGQLTVGHIDEYLWDCTEKGLSRATIIRRIASLSSLLGRAGMEELAKATRDIGKARIGGKAEMKPFHPLNPEEVEKLQEVSRDNPRALAIIAIILGTGATVEQIRALNASDVLEYENQRVAVRFRGNKSKRQIALDINASEIVRSHVGIRDGEEPLFVQRSPIRLGDDRLTRQSIWNDVRQYGERIGRPDLSPRLLRETFIARVQTSDPKLLRKLLGITEGEAHQLLERRRLTQQLPQSEVLFEVATTN